MGQRRGCKLVFWAFVGVSLADWSARVSAADPDAPPVASPRKVETAPDGWVAGAQRDEIRPEFAHQPGSAADGRACLIIKADHREGLDGFWKKAVAVTGGKAYRFQASYQAKGIAVPRLSIVAEIRWRDGKGRPVPQDDPPVSGFLNGATAMAETEFPTTRATDGRGWTEVSDTYRAPLRATQAIVELHLRWAPGGEVRWAGVSLTETGSMPQRTVRLATVHFKPSGGQTPADNCRMYEPLIAEAARRKADMVVLGETLTFVGLGKSYADVAEPVPAPRPSISAGWPGCTTCTSCPVCSSATATWSTTSPC